VALVFDLTDPGRSADIGRYISAARAQGNTDEQIKRSLLKFGHIRLASQPDQAKRVAELTGAPIEAVTQEEVERTSVAGEFATGIGESVSRRGQAFEGGLTKLGAEVPELAASMASSGLLAGTGLGVQHTPQLTELLMGGADVATGGLMRGTTEELESEGDRKVEEAIEGTEGVERLSIRAAALAGEYADIALPIFGVGTTRILSRFGRKLLGKGTLSEADFTLAFADAIEEEVALKASRLGSAISRQKITKGIKGAGALEEAQAAETARLVAQYRIEAEGTNATTRAALRKGLERELGEFEGASVVLQKHLPTMDLGNLTQKEMVRLFTGKLKGPELQTALREGQRKSLQNAFIRARARESITAEEAVMMGTLFEDLARTETVVLSQKQGAALEKRAAKLGVEFKPAEGVVVDAEVMAEIRPGVGFLNWVREKARIGGSLFLGGPAAEFRGGKARRAAYTYANPAHREWIMKEIPRTFTLARGQEKELLFKAQDIRRAISAEVVSVSRALGKNPREIGEVLNRARREGDLATIPWLGLREKVARAGNLIDDFSRRFIEEGMTGPSVNRFKENLGTYMHTHYKAHNAKNWTDAVRETGAWEDAFRFFKETMPDAPDFEIYGYMGWLTSRGKGASLRQMGEALPRQILSELKHKKDLPREITALLGIEESFIPNFDRTTALMAHDLVTTQLQRTWLRELIERGMARSRPWEVPKGREVVPITLDRLSASGPVWVEKTTAEMLGMLEQSSQHSIIDTLAFLNGVTKFGKVGVSPSTQSRNVLSLIPMLIQSGSLTLRTTLISPQAVGQAAKRTRDLFSARGVAPFKALDAATKAEIRKAAALDLLSPGALAGEQLIHMEQAGRMFAGRNFKSMPARAFKSGWEWLGRTYQAVDEAGKFFSWQLNKSRLNSLVKTDADRAFIRTRFGSDNVEVAAAEIVKETMQHFPRTAPIGKKLSRTPIAGTFVSFPLEMARNAKNSAKISAWEMEHALATGRLDWMTSAVERFAGLVAVVAGPPAAEAVNEHRLGITTPIKEAFREELAWPWARNGNYMVLDREDGKWTYLDWGFSNPQKEISEALTGLLVRPGTIPERLGRLVEDLEGVFAGEEIFFTGAVEALVNRRFQGTITETFREGAGKKISERGSPDYWGRRLFHFTRAVAPGGALSMDKLRKSLDIQPDQDWLIPGISYDVGIPSKSAQEREFEPEFINVLGGPRIVTVDAEEVFKKWRAPHLRGLKRGLQTALIEDIRIRGRGFSSDHFEREWAKAADEIQTALNNFRELGIDDRVMFEEMQKGSIFRREEARALVKGREIPFEFAFQSTLRRAN